MGTPAYMSPEQCRGTREIDHRTDIYALGVIVYEMVCGRAPFVSEGFGEMIHLHMNMPPPPPRSINPDVPPDLERLILWCLAKEPNERIQTMNDVHAALTGRPTPPMRSAAAKVAVPPAAVSANPTTFTQAAQAGAGTDVLPQSRGRRTPAIVLGVLCAAAGGLWLTRASWMPRTSDTVTVGPATPTPARGDTPPPAAPPKIVASVKAAIVSDPPGARVVREKDGAVIGMTPFRETWPSGDGVTKLRLELDGYRPEPVVVPLDRGVDLSFTLHRAQPAEPQHKHKESKHGAAAKSPAGPPSTAPKSPPRLEPVPL
jgi:serine/threonine-protein kinase